MQTRMIATRLVRSIGNLQASSLRGSTSKRADAIAPCNNGCFLEWQAAYCSTSQTTQFEACVAAKDAVSAWDPRAVMADFDGSTIRDN